MVRPPDLRSADRLPTFSRHCLLSVSIDQLDKAPRSSRRRIYISFPCNASSHSPTASRGIPSPLQHPRGSKTTRKFNRACTGPPDPTTLPASEPARAWLRTVRAMLNPSCPALLAALSLLLTTNPSGSIIARCRCSLAPQGASHRPPHVTPSLLPSPRPHSHHASSPRSTYRNTLRLRYAPPSHLMDSRSVWQEVAEVAPHHIRQDSARAIWRAYGRSLLLRFS
jgi:hypothetical protein